jgi:hypothetical protein
MPQGVAAMPADKLDSGFSDQPAADFDPVTKMRQQVSAEKLRLTLREIRQAHGELDAREDAERRVAAEQEGREARARQLAEREREAARGRADSEAEARRQAEAKRLELKTKRRALIQEVKTVVVDRWYLNFRLSSELKAQILQAIEVALLPLPVEELPQTELIQIAEGARDRLYSRAIDAQTAAAAKAQQRQALLTFGMEYAREELRAIQGLDLTERWRIETLVQGELKDLTGDETRLEMRAWVDEILDEEGFGLEDEESAE